MAVITLVHMSDLHFEASDDARYLGQDTLQTFRACVERARQAGLLPGCELILSGDLSNHGEPESYVRLRAEIEALKAEGIEVLAGLGNHDHRAHFEEVFLGRSGDAAWQPYYYSHMVGGLRVIMLDSSIPNSPEGEIDPGQLQWLALQLREPAAEGTVVVIHHPPVSKKVHALPMEMVRNDHELASVLSGSDVVGILSGHIHFPLTTSLAGIPVAAAAGTAHLLDPWELKGLRMVGGSGFNVVTIRDGGFEVVSMLMPGEQQEIGYYPMDLLRKHLAAAGAAVHA